MTDRYRLAVVGVDHPHAAGWRRVLENLADRVEISAVVPRYDDGTASLEERHSHLPRATTVDALIQHGNFDGALVCLPNDESPSAAIQLAAAGKDVLVEKPVAGSTKDVAPLVDAVAASGVAFQNGYTFRYNEATARLREMVADGRFGKLISIEMLYVTSSVARRGPNHYLFNERISTGGFFNWLACHWLDLLFYITGEVVTAVTACVGQFGETTVDVEDGGVAILQLESGALASLTGGYWIPRWQGESAWTVRGSERWVHWDPAREGTGGALEIHGPQPQWVAMEETFTLPVDTTPGYGGAMAAALLEDWLDACERRRTSGTAPPCRNTPASTMATLELIDAIYESSRSGQRIDCSIAPG